MSKCLSYESQMTCLRQLNNMSEKMTTAERYTYILDYFRRNMPAATTELQFGSVFQLLVATVLSAQCTDKRVNMVTEELFRRYPDARRMAAADVDDIREYISSVSYPNAKAAHLQAMARMIMADYGGDVPQDTAQLMRLPGVGRKTANVIQAVGFGKPAIAVDTHVYRVSHRMALAPAKADTPDKVEACLRRHIPKDEWAQAHHWLLLHGRYTCKSRKPLCHKCPFDNVCPKKGVIQNGHVQANKT